tara:strand:- start:870 stop:1031 length:162 start_codon:yes stop_codon:yes gene_type:complete
MGNICQALDCCLYNDYEKCLSTENIRATVKKEEFSQFIKNKEDYGYYCLDEEF